MITYRAPRRDEAAALATLGRDTFVETFGHLYRPEDLAAFLTSIYAEDSIARQLDSDRILYRLAEDAGQLVGYCKLGLDVSLDYDPGDKTVIELKQLYVFASHHGSGVGQALMDWTIAEAQARDADEILLSVYADNARGQGFYKRNGFRWIADTYFMVGNHRDEEYLFLRSMN
ncbi:MAG: GNAT family N-acetyltransferase [Sphingomonadaceae bacterium]|jgi:ribosomal protein S18 acetylase RimI-like enzyme|nr:GNAT family N-acetyltransferase [Sphingomonadaceae bacterium]NBU79221.1 GNAT family N-acetyltransferase [Sphingomonadaceae bacterium]NCA01340.1 GNAT family N-acetyltransferase [Sphingomonadaceae bacterium]